MSEENSKKGSLIKRFLVLGILILVLDNPLYMFGMLIASYSGDLFSLTIPLLAFFMSNRLSEIVLSNVQFTLQIYAYALICYGLLSVLFSGPVKRNPPIARGLPASWIIFILALLDLSTHPSAKLITAPNELTASIIRAFSNASLSQYINIGAKLSNVTLECIIYTLLVLLISLVKNTDTWQRVELHREVGIVLLLDGILKIACGALLLKLS